MKYALISNGIVTNLISMHPANAADFPSALPTGDLPVAMGDIWDGTRFTRDGAPLLTPLETLQAEVAALDAAFLNLTYQTVLGGIEP